MNSSNGMDMLLVIKEEPDTMADSLFMNTNNDDLAMPMMSVKEEPVGMEDEMNQSGRWNESTVESSEREAKGLDNPFCFEIDHDALKDKGLDNPFCFETDHVALKTNKDYQHLLRTTILLHAQRQTALKDIDALYNMRKLAMKDPIQFVQKLQSKVDMGFPRAQKVASLPVIPWDQYTTDVDAALSMAAAGRGGSAPLTRNKIKTLLNIKDDPEPVTDSVTSSQMEDGAENGTRIRSVTFNQRWSVEEQMRFEQLVKKYPEERNQTKRHEKIALELGTRTTVQVASHYQKFVKKLVQWNLPVPGPMPRGVALRRKRGGVGGRGRQRQSYSDLYGQSSTFLASFEVPVYMSENESEDNAYPGASYMGHNGDYTANSETTSGSSDEAVAPDLDEDLIPQHLKNSAEYLELKQLENIKRDFEGVNSTVRYTKSELICVACGEKLAGVSYKCENCPAVQFCSACSKIEFKNGSHKSNHILSVVDINLVGAQAVDKDYSNSEAGTYSYLDPNYRCKKAD